MTLISNFKATNSGYNNLFNNKEIGKLITIIHAAKISSGTELEHIIEETPNVNLVGNVDQFFDNINNFDIGTYLVNKKSLKNSKISSIVSYKLRKTILVDFIIVKINENKSKHCYIIELKSGCNFDTKKIPAEKDNLIKYESELAKKIQATTSIHLCSFFEEDKNKIITGLKNIFELDEILTGSEICNLLNIKYEDVLEKTNKDKIANDKYFFDRINEIMKKENV